MSAASCCGSSPRIPSSRRRSCSATARPGSALGAVHPHLAAAYPDAVFEKFDEASLDGIDLVFAALPHGHSQRLAGAILDQRHPVRRSRRRLPARRRGDLRALVRPCARGAGAARPVRLRHPRAQSRGDPGAKAVAAAGCYATAAILALKPLVDAGLVKPDSLIVDAASGVSGAGREAKEATAFSTVDGSFAAYGLLNHRHTAEMEMAMGGTVLFTPAPRADDPRHPCDLLRRGDRPVRSARSRCAPLMPTSRSSTSPTEPPATKWVTGSNGVPAHRPLRRAHRPRARARRRSTISARAPPAR